MKREGCHNYSFTKISYCNYKCIFYTRYLQMLEAHNYFKQPKVCRRKLEAHVVEYQNLSCKRLRIFPYVLCVSVVWTLSDALSKLLETLLNTRLAGIKISNQSAYEAQPTAEQQLWASQLGLCWLDLEVLQLHGHAHVPRDLQLPLEERLRGPDVEREQIKKRCLGPN